MLEKKKFIKELKAMHNDIGIIYDSELVRLVGYHQDDMDCYYTIRCPPGPNVKFYSAVGWFFSLRGLIPSERYQSMDNIFSLNGAPPTKTFFVSSETENAMDDLLSTYIKFNSLKNTDNFRKLIKNG